MSEGLPTPDTQRWIAVARLLRPQGRRGEILTEPLSDLPELFTTGRAFCLSLEEKGLDRAPVIVLEECWRPQGRNAGRLVLKLTGVDSISAAEALESRQLFLPETELPALAPDTYLVRDLVGCALFDGDQRVGTVTDLQFPVGPDGRTRLVDAVDLLVVEPDSPTPADASPDADATESRLIPFVKAWLTAVDLPGKRITMQLPPGLMD